MRLHKGSRLSNESRSYNHTRNGRFSNSSLFASSLGIQISSQESASPSTGGHRSSKKIAQLATTSDPLHD